MKDDHVYLQHIQDSLDDIVRYCGEDRHAFFTDPMRQDATLRKLEVIGQAVKNLSDHTKSLQPEIPWKQIAGMRDKVIHDYFGGTCRAQSFSRAVPTPASAANHRPRSQRQYPP